MHQDLPNATCRVFCKFSKDSIFEPCLICPALANLETLISDGTQDTPQDLQEKYIQLKKSRNLSHDRLTNPLPVELVSRIFSLVESSDSFFSGFLNPKTYVCVPVRLSRICSRWREIALATPQLWTNVFLNLQKHSNHLDITKEWLLRSGSLPLNLGVYQDRTTEYGIFSLTPIIYVLRSHSSRWSYLNFNEVHDTVLYQLFNDLDIVPSSVSLSLRLRRQFHEIPFSLYTPLRPREFFSIQYGGEGLKSFKWDNLMVLQMMDGHITDALHIIGQAPNLQSCGFDCLGPPSRLMMPNDSQNLVEPIIHQALKTLTLSVSHQFDLRICRHLTLPSLNSLNCNISCFRAPLPDGLIFDDLAHLIERSGLGHGRLPHFSLYYHTSTKPDFARNNLFSLTAVTDLRISIYTTDALSTFLQRFSDIAVFPYLQSLNIQGKVYAYTDSWDIFCDFIVEQNSSIRASTDSQILQGEKGHDDITVSNENRIVSLDATSLQLPSPRPLKFVGFKFVESIKEDFKIRKDTFLRLRDAQNEGPIRLQIGSSEGTDILQSMKEEDGFILIEKPPFTR